MFIYNMTFRQLLILRDLVNNNLLMSCQILIVLKKWHVLIKKQKNSIIGTGG